MGPSSYSHPPTHNFQPCFFFSPLFHSPQPHPPPPPAWLPGNGMFRPLLKAASKVALLLTASKNKTFCSLIDSNSHFPSSYSLPGAAANSHNLLLSHFTPPVSKKIALSKTINADTDLSENNDRLLELLF
ncbi:hypothetical protein AMECASPLE_002356 [Ameca splendens]|uniref:Uncharacterized protein n=1 Tax=Ameca splendens TaxID=208324 RepID=A0ABV0ZU77_9TELE